MNFGTLEQHIKSSIFDYTIDNGSTRPELVTYYQFLHRLDRMYYFDGLEGLITFTEVEGERYHETIVLEHSRTVIANLEAQYKKSPLNKVTVYPKSSTVNDASPSSVSVSEIHPMSDVFGIRVEVDEPLFVHYDPFGNRHDVGTTRLQEVLSSSRYFVHQLVLEEILRVHRIFIEEHHSFEDVLNPQEVVEYLLDQAKNKGISGRPKGTKKARVLKRIECILGLEVHMAKLSSFLAKDRSIGCTPNEFLEHFTFDGKVCRLLDETTPWEEINDTSVTMIPVTTDLNSTIPWLAPVNLLAALIGFLFEVKEYRIQRNGKLVIVKEPISNYHVTKVNVHFCYENGDEMEAGSIRSGKTDVKRTVSWEDRKYSEYYMESERLFRVFFKRVFPFDRGLPG